MMNHYVLYSWQSPDLSPAQCRIRNTFADFQDSRIVGEAASTASETVNKAFHA